MSDVFSFQQPDDLRNAEISKKVEPEENYYSYTSEGKIKYTKYEGSAGVIRENDPVPFDSRFHFKAEPNQPIAAEDLAKIVALQKEVDELKNKNWTNAEIILRNIFKELSESPSMIERMCERLEDIGVVEATYEGDDEDFCEECGQVECEC